MCSGYHYLSPMNLFKQFTYKKFGLLKFDPANATAIHEPDFNAFIKILLLKAGSSIQVDFNRYQLKQDALFFINVNQLYRLGEAGKNTGYLIYYNRDFYCVQIHDKEVACDGILYNNVYEIPVILLSKENSKIMSDIFAELNEELKNDDASMEEMLRILLKEIIIKSTRIWKSRHDVSNKEEHQEVEFLRKFSQLVELNFRQLHAVSQYADLLNITPKALNKRISKYGKSTPNDMIKDRIMLEAKRLLVHTDRNVKEIAYSLGYDDPAYFNRLFTKLAGSAPADFRRHYAS
jgi:AraC-like DNA-binding protein